MTPIAGRSKAIICDLDGTLCLFDRAIKNPYHRDFENDVENPAVMELLKRIDACNTAGLGDEIQILFVSGRSDKYRKVTRTWLRDRGFGEYPLFMRPRNDFRMDAELKLEIYQQHIQDHYEVMFVLDDRDQVVSLWRAIGLSCFQVAPGDF